MNDTTCFCLMFLLVLAFVIVTHMVAEYYEIKRDEAVKDASLRCRSAK